MNQHQSDANDSLLVRELRPAPAGARALLAQTGVDPAFLDRWLAEGRTFVAGDLADAGEGPSAAAALLLAAGGPTVELRLVGVADEDEQAAQRLLRGLARQVCSEGIRRILAPVRTDDVRLIAILQAAGFRPAHVERDAAVPERGYPPSAVRDLLWLERAL